MLRCDCCEKEKSKQSVHSPSVVSDDEYLVYVVLEPDQYKDDELSTAAFSKSKLKDGDLSICRKAYSNAADIRQNIVDPQIENKPHRREVGALQAQCSDVRSILTDNPVCRAFCVNDDGLEGFEAHALLAFSDPTKAPNFWNANDRLAIRANLVRSFGGNSAIVPIDELFP